MENILKGNFKLLKRMVNITHNDQFLLLPHCFQKSSAIEVKHEKMSVWGKGLKLLECRLWTVETIENKPLSHTDSKADSVLYDFWNHCGKGECKVLFQIQICNRFHLMILEILLSPKLVYLRTKKIN